MSCQGTLSLCNVHTIVCIILPENNIIFFFSKIIKLEGLGLICCGDNKW
jgi:hypothetical protein